MGDIQQGSNTEPLGNITDLSGNPATGLVNCRATLSWIQKAIVPLGTTLISVQPTDLTKATFSLGLYDNSFLGQDDSVFGVGYNLASLLAGSNPLGEPSAGWIIEQNYKAGPTDIRIEAYLELAGSAGGVLRPIIASVQRSDCSGVVSLTLPPGATSYLDISDNAGNQLLKFFPANGIGPAGAVLVQAGVKVLFAVPGVGSGLGDLFVDAAGNLTYTGPNGTTKILAGP